MLQKVIAVGRSGSGKTTAVKQIALDSKHMISHSNASNKECLVWQFKDYEILYEMFQEDKNCEDESTRKFRPAEYPGFELRDYSLFDKALDKLNETLMNFLRDHAHDEGIITIEFARNNYRQALSKFDPSILKDASLLFINCELEECISRIYKRIWTPGPDFHFVPESIMRTYFFDDDKDFIENECRKAFSLLKDVRIINNTNITLEEFKAQISAFTESLIKVPV